MPPGFSDYLENKLVDLTLRGVAYAGVAAPYMSLHSADPGETGANEIAGGSYARKTVAFNAAVVGHTDNAADLTWADMPAVTLTHVGIWDAASAGNYLYSAILSSPKVIAAGDTFKVAAGDLDIQLD